MYKIILADDEGIVLESLQYIIEKNFKGLCEVETAKSGRKVIEIAESFNPDIAFIDIQMIGINGIDAMKEIRKKNRNMIFIVLTAYDLFDYAKESVHLGVLEYLNKPIQKQEIIDVLQLAMNEVDARKHKRSMELKTREKIEAFLPVMENSFIDGLLFHDYQEEEIAWFKEMLGIDGPYGYFSVLQFDKWNTDTNKDSITRSLKKEQGFIRDQIKKSISCLVGTPIQNRIPLYLPIKYTKTNKEKETAIYSIWCALQDKLVRQNNIELRIGIGEICPQEMACCSYYQAMEALVLSGNPVSCSWKLCRAEKKPADILTLEEQICDAIKEGDVSQCRELSKLFFQQLEEQYGKSIPADPSIDELKQTLIMKLEAACSRVKLQKEDGQKSLIARGKEYIEKHFQEDISLFELAESLAISPHYFSRLFKEKEGMNYIEYLTCIRMQYAKKMLKKTNASIQEICSLSGYTDPNYFSRIFKKTVGMTPSDYREERQERL